MPPNGKNHKDELSLFFEKLAKLSDKSRLKIQKIADETGGTFIGAAWSIIHDKKKYSPHKTASNTKSKQTRPANDNKVIPIIKILRPGIRTIILKKVK